MKSNSIRWVRLALPGIVGVVLTWFGLMGSAFSQPGQQNPVSVTLIWLLTGPGSPGSPAMASNGIMNQGDQVAPNENQSVVAGYLWQSLGCQQ